MSCPNCNCNPCSCQCSCDPANEAVSSALSNLQSNFLGSVTKQCVNGEVVWVLPCNLNTDFPGYPRLEDEALLCYWQRVISALAQGGVTLCDALNQICALTLSPGDILYVNALGDIVNLPIGSSNQFLKSSAGFPTWSVLPLITEPYVLIEHQEANGVNGGSSAGASWTTFGLNTIVSDLGSNVTSLIAGEFMLEAGIYEVYGATPLNTGLSGSAREKLRLRNITDGATVIVGMSCFQFEAGNFAFLSGLFTADPTKSYALQYYDSAGYATTGLGLATNAGEVEVYSTIVLRKKS